MNWRPTIYWGLLAAFVGICALALTRWITAYHPGTGRQIGVVFEEHPSAAHVVPRFVGDEVMPFGTQLPRIVVTNSNELLLVITHATRSIILAGFVGGHPTCSAMDDAASNASVAALVQAVKRLHMTPIPTERADLASLGIVTPQLPDMTPSELAGNIPAVVIRIPPALTAKVKALKHGQGVVQCEFSSSLAASPTFTDRSVTIVTLSSHSGPALLDVSALTNIVDLRFFGGTVLPWEGSRTRAFDQTDQLVLVEWSDVAAEEQRDVILVIIGALAAISAATLLEAVRPIVEKVSAKI
jgi:hypothetical protein